MQHRTACIQAQSSDRFPIEASGPKAQGHSRDPNSHQSQAQDRASVNSRHKNSHLTHSHPPGTQQDRDHTAMKSKFERRTSFVRCIICRYTILQKRLHFKLYQAQFLIFVKIADFLCQRRYVKLPDPDTFCVYHFLFPTLYIVFSSFDNSIYCICKYNCKIYPKW